MNELTPDQIIGIKEIIQRALEEDIGRLDDVGRDLVEAGAFENRHDGRVLPLQRLALGPGLAGHG